MKDFVESRPGIGRGSRGAAARPPAGASVAEFPDPTRRRALLILPVMLALGACGQKGALFLPEGEGDGEEARALPVPESTA